MNIDIKTINNIINQINEFIGSTQLNKSAKITLYYGNQVFDNILNCSIDTNHFTKIMDKVHKISKIPETYINKQYVYRNLYRNIKCVRGNTTKQVSQHEYFSNIPIKYFISNKLYAIIYEHKQIEKVEFPIINNYDSISNELITEYRHDYKTCSLYTNFSKSKINMITINSEISISHIEALKNFLLSIKLVK